MPPVISTVITFLCFFACPSGFTQEIETGNFSSLNKSEKCSMDVEKWISGCYKPTTRWLRDFKTDESNAMKKCKDGCVVKGLTQFVKKNYRDFQSQRCYVRCPCLESSYCNDAVLFKKQDCPQEIKAGALWYCTNQNINVPVRSTNGIASKPGTNAMTTTTEEPISFYHNGPTASERSSSGATEERKTGDSLPTARFPHDDSTKSALEQENNDRTNSSTSHGYSDQVPLSSAEWSTGSKSAYYTDATVAETAYQTTPSLESGSLLRQHSTAESTVRVTSPASPVSDNTDASLSLEIGSATAMSPTSVYSQTSSIGSSTSSVLSQVPSAYSQASEVAYSSRAGDAELASSTTRSAETLSAESETASPESFTSTSSNTVSEEMSSPIESHHELTSAATFSIHEEPTAKTSEDIETTTWTSGQTYSSVPKSLTEFVDSTSSDAATSEKYDYTSASQAGTTDEASTDGQEALVFHKSFTTVDTTVAPSRETMTTTEFKRTPFTLFSLRSSPESKEVPATSTAKPSPLVTSNSSTSSHPHDVDHFSGSVHYTSTSSTDDYSKIPTEKSTLKSVSSSMPWTTKGSNTETTQPDVRSETTESVSGMESTSVEAEQTTDGTKKQADSSTSAFVDQGTSTSDSSTNSEAPTKSSSSDPSPCPAEYFEGPTSCYRFTPPSANSYRKASKFCTLDKNSDLIDEANLRNSEVLPFMKNLSETQSPQIDLLFINEDGSKLLKKTHSVRIVSLLRSNVAHLKVNATAGIDTISLNTTGICRFPKFGDQLSCDLETVSFYRPGGDLVLPANRTLQIGEVANISCTGTKSKVQVTCDNNGRLTPHPTMIECETDDGEKETAWNRKIRSSCTECWKWGTEKCVRVEGGVLCKCRERWTGFTCWRSPNQCALTGLTCEHGKCQSQVDRAVCVCDEEFAGARCTVNKSELAFYSDTKSSFVSAPTMSAAALFFTEMTLIVAYNLLKDESLEGQDPQVFFQKARSYVLATAGLAVVLFRHPALLGLRGYGCGFWFIVTTSLLSCGTGLLALEARNAFRTTKLLGTNTWRSVLTGYTQKRTELGFQVGCVVFSSMAVVLFVFVTMYDQVTSTWSCLGRFTLTSTDLWFPLIQLNTVAALAATSYSYKGLYIKRNLPQYQEMLDEFARTVPSDVRNTIEKCHRDLPFTMAGPWLLLGYWQFLAVASDWMTDTVSNTLTVAFALLYCAMELLQFVVTTPSLYSKAIWTAIRLLPSSLAPASDPVTRWSQEEILARFERGARARLRRSRFRFRHLRPAHRGYLPRVARRELEERWSDAYKKLREKHPNKTKASIIQMIYRHDVVRMRTLERSMAKRGSIKKVFRRWSTYAYCKDPKPDVDPRRRPETEHERMMRELEEIWQGLYLVNGPPPIIRGSMLERNRVVVKDRPSQSVPIAIVTAIDNYGCTYQQAVLKAPVAVVREELFPSTSRGIGDVDRLERGENRSANNPAQGEDELDRETREYIEQLTESAFEMAVQNQDYLERLLALRSW